MGPEHGPVAVSHKGYLQSESNAKTNLATSPPDSLMRFLMVPFVQGSDVCQMLRPLTVALNGKLTSSKQHLHRGQAQHLAGVRRRSSTGSG